MIKLISSLILAISTVSVSIFSLLPLNSAGGLSTNTAVQAVVLKDVVITDPQIIQGQAVDDASQKIYTYGNPAGCGESAPSLSSAERLSNVQAQLPELDLTMLRMNIIWNGPLNSMVDVSNDPFVYEFSIDTYLPPFTFLADKAVTVFLENGFVVWLRNYDGHFRLIAVPLIAGVYETNWGDTSRRTGPPASQAMRRSILL